MRPVPKLLRLARSIPLKRDVLPLPGTQMVALSAPCRLRLSSSLLSLNFE